MKEQCQIRWGSARVEFISLKDEIISMKKNGYSLRSIYEKFFDEKRITMKYRNFCKLANIFIGVSKRKTNNNSVICNVDTSKAKENVVIKQERKPIINGSHNDTTFGKKQFDIDELV